MTNFELCYEIKDTKKYIVPELLSDKIPEKGYPKGFKEQEKTEILHFEYRYKFMPKGIVSRLIVRMNMYIYKKLQWKNGAILDYERTFAEVKEQYNEKKLKIRIYGDNKKGLLSIVRKEINSIHKSFEKLNVYEMIPCTCNECKKSFEPYFYKYSLLQKCQAKGKEIVFCEISLEDVKVENLLNGVFMQSWDVFISYSSKDFTIIKKIVNDFKRNKITYWLDDEQINPGDFIIPQIEKGLNNSQYVVLCFSRNQLKSGWSRAEYESVLYEIFSDKQSNRKVIPLIIDDLKPNELPRLTMAIMQTNLSDSRAYQKLLDFLKKK